MNLDVQELPMPITLRPAAPLSDDELMQFSRSNEPYRIEQNKEGVLTIMVPVGGIGSNLEFLVSAAFAYWMDSGVDGMSFSPTGGFRLADGSCLSPDGAWISGERWNGLTPEEQDGYPPLCPDFLVELRSRSDRRSVLEEKMQLWMANGARLAWLNDPFEATVTIYRQGAAEQTLHRPDEVAADEPARGFVSRTARFWPQH